MKASMSLSSEMDIVLTSEEISSLEREIIIGKVKVRNEGQDNLEPRGLKLSVGAVEKNLYLDLRSYPERASFETIAEYEITISRDGYELLKEKGKVIDRTGGPSKVYISLQGRLQE